MSEAAAILPMVGGIVSSQLTMDAQDRAFQKVNTAVHMAIANQLDPGTAASESAAQDITKYQAGFAAQSKYDPILSKLRTAGATDLLNTLQDDRKKNQEDSVLDTLVNENVPADQKREAVKNLLLDKAKENLDLGATLSPTYQAELIRAGLASGGRGLPTAEGPAGVQARELIGVQGEQLKMARQSMAQNQVGTVTAMDQARASILNSLIPSLMSVQNARMNRAGQAYTVGQAAVPSIGMTGNDLVNLHLQNIATKNQLMLGLANTSAQKSMADAAATNQMISQGTSLGGMLGGMGGGGGGMMGMMGGGGGGGGGMSFSNQMYGPGASSIWGG
jgi:hypothetical protein